MVRRHGGFGHGSCGNGECGHCGDDDCGYGDCGYGYCVHSDCEHSDMVTTIVVGLQCPRGTGPAEISRRAVEALPDGHVVDMSKCTSRGSICDTWIRDERPGYNICFNLNCPKVPVWSLVENIVVVVLNWK